MDTNMTFRMDSDVKNQMAAICEQLGMTTSTAFNIFANAFVRAKGMPFTVALQEPVEYVTRERMLADTSQILTEFASDYKKDGGMKWVKVEDVILIHAKVIEMSGGMDGVRDRPGLEAAVAVPLQSFEGQDFYPTVLEKIARLGYGLAANHAFVDGNKRVGAIMVQHLLKWNGHCLKLREGELADMFIAIADGKADTQALLDWIRAHLQ